MHDTPSERRITKRRITERRITERRITECRITERRITERRITERRIIEHQITERRITERQKLPNAELLNAKRYWTTKINPNTYEHDLKDGHVNMYCIVIIGENVLHHQQFIIHFYMYLLKIFTVEGGPRK